MVCTITLLSWNYNYIVIIFILQSELNGCYIHMFRSNCCFIVIIEQLQQLLLLDDGCFLYTRRCHPGGACSDVPSVVEELVRSVWKPSDTAISNSLHKVLPVGYEFFLLLMFETEKS